MIHALIPSIVPINSRRRTTFEDCACGMENADLLVSIAKRHARNVKWCDLRDRTAERNAETLVRVRRISPEAGGLPDEIYLEMWLV